MRFRAILKLLFGSSSSSSSRELREARGVVVFCFGNSLVGLLRGSLADWLATALLLQFAILIVCLLALLCFVWLLLAYLVCFDLLALLVCQLHFAYVAWFAWLARRARVLTWFGLDSLCSDRKSRTFWIRGKSSVNWSWAWFFRWKMWKISKSSCSTSNLQRNSL